MGKYFSDVVDKAIEDLYYCCDNDKAKTAADALLLAAKEDDWGRLLFPLPLLFWPMLQLGIPPL